MEKGQIREWITNVFEGFGLEHIFLIDIDWNPSSKKLVIYLDGDKDLTLSRCQEISRMFEAKLDETLLIGEKYALEVSSPGLDRPLRIRRQYVKNVGRVLRFHFADGRTVIGKLVSVEGDVLKVLPEKRVGKKNQVKYGAEIIIEFEEIDKAFVEVRF